MSTWDDFRALRYRQSHERGPASRDFTYTLAFSPSPRRLWRMLCFEERDLWSVADLADLAQLCESYVLYDCVGISWQLSELAGPYFVEQYKDQADYPMFEFNGQIEAGFAALRERTVEDPGGTAQLRLAALLKRPSLFPDDVCEHLENLLQSDVAQVPDMAEEWLSLHAQSLALLHGSLAEDVLRDDQDWNPRLQPQLPFLGEQLLHLSREMGLAVSPGSAYSSTFLAAKAPPVLVASARDELNHAHASITATLEKWSQPRSAPVPPLMAIWLSRSPTRADLVPQLVRLRQEFTELREALRKLQRSFEEAQTLADKLKAIERLETLRSQLLEKAAKSPGRSIVRRTWQVARKGSLLGGAMELADLLFNIGNERRVLGGLQRMVDIERTVLNGALPSAQVRRLFGEIR